MTCRCWCSRRARWRAVRWRGWWPRDSRGTHEWTGKKAVLLEAFDQSGITAVFMDPEQGGYLVGPKNLALALIAFELAWVDAGAATCSLAGCLALAPIHERGTDGTARALHVAGRSRRRRAKIAKPGAGPSALPSRFPTLAWIPAC